MEYGRLNSGRIPLAEVSHPASGCFINQSECRFAHTDLQLPAARESLRWISRFFDVFSTSMSRRLSWPSRTPYDLNGRSLTCVARKIQPASEAAARTFCERNERRENSPLAQIPERQNFRVPLHSKDEGMVRALNAFNQAIGRGGIDDQPFAELFDGLMVGRIDLQRLPLEYFSQSSP